jgi:cytochrome o ubiquinol oxidase subunit III
MSGSAATPSDPYHLGAAMAGGHSLTAHGEHDLLSKRIVTGFGFWVFLLSDIIMFSAFFASFAVLRDNTAGGPAGRDVFDITSTALETTLLLVSSFTCGVAFIGAQLKRNSWYYGAMAATFVLGVGFLLLESREFAGLVALGYGPQRSAFLSSFFTLVGCHGVHVALGLLWLLTMMAQVFAKGYRPDIMRRLLCFSLFWHALDIIWVALFTIVYLIGVTT